MDSNKLVHFVRGDLLASDCTVIMHQANCFGKMGAGIAKEIARIYPGAYTADQMHFHPIGSKKRLGSYSTSIAPNGVLVCNLYGQYHYGRGKQTHYQAFEQSLSHAITQVTHSGLKDIKIGLPYKIGCGLAGGDWGIVLAIIYKVARDKNWPIYLYKI